MTRNLMWPKSIVSLARTCGTLCLIFITSACGRLGAPSHSTYKFNVPNSSSVLLQRTVEELRIDGRGNEVMFSSNGRRLLIKDRSTCQIWDVSTWKPIGQPLDTDWRVYAEMDSVGERLLTAYSEIKNGKVIEGEARVWHLQAERELLRTLDHGGGKPLRTSTISPNGQLIATSGQDDRFVHLWSVKTGELDQSIECQDRVIHKVTFSSDGSLLYVVGSTVDTVEVWDVEHRIWKSRLRSEAIIRAAFSLNGYVAIRTLGGVVIYDINTTRLLQAINVENQYDPSIYISPDGSYVAVDSIWSVKSGKKVMDTHGGKPIFDYHGRFVVLLLPDEHAGLWDMKTGRRIRKFDPKQKWQSAAFSPDSRMLVLVDFESTLILHAIQGTGGELQWCDG